MQFLLRIESLQRTLLTSTLNTYSHNAIRPAAELFSRRVSNVYPLKQCNQTKRGMRYGLLNRPVSRWQKGYTTTRMVDARCSKTDFKVILLAKCSRRHSFVENNEKSVSFGSVLTWDRTQNRNLVACFGDGLADVSFLRRFDSPQCTQPRFLSTKPSNAVAESNRKDLKDDVSQESAKKKATTDARFDVILTVPNVLTTLRMALTPVLGYLVIQESYSLACGVFVVAGLTDLLDGVIARNFQNQTSALGSFIDPLADKLLISTLFLSLTAVNLLPVLLTVLVVARDICLMTGGFYVRYISLNPRPKNLREFFDITNPSAKLQPTFASKVNTAVQLSVVAFTLAAPVFDYVDHPAIQALWYLTAATTVVSGVGYIFAKDTFKLLQQKRKSN